MSIAAPPRLLRPVGPPLGSYIRVGRDSRPLQALIAESRANLSGLVFDAWAPGSQGDLRNAARQHGLETVLDTHALELATPGGIANEHVCALPWAGEELPHTQAGLRGAQGDRLVEAIADEAAERQYTAVLAPSHLLTAPGDGWLDLDVDLAIKLRARLDRRGLQRVPLYYSLTVRTQLFSDAAARQVIVARLSRAPVDALWLRIHPFGTTSAGPLAIRRYIEGARDLHRLGLPLVAEHVGTVGVALLAFGAVGGIESGVTLGERFDAGRLLKPPTGGKGFAPAPRVYLAPIGAFVSREQARQLFTHRQLRSALACRDTACCHRGPADTSLDPRRHFLLQRMREVTAVGGPPEPLRAGLYLEDFLRPATDIAMRAARVDPQLERTRQRLEGWRQTLGAMHQAGPPATFATVPEGKRITPRLQAGA